VTDRKERKQQQSGKATPRGGDAIAAEIRRVCDRLEAEGLIVHNGIKIGRTRFIKIKLPPAAAPLKETIEIGTNRSLEILERPPKSPKLEKVVTEIIARVRRVLGKAKLNVEPVRLGEWIFVPIIEKTRSESSCPSVSKKALLSAVPIPRANRSSSIADHVADCVKRKLLNPVGNPTMTIVEVAYALGKSKPTIYRMLEAGVLSRTNVPGAIRIRTELVNSLL
jgi:excisionase family DNA binding protein